MSKKLTLQEKIDKVVGDTVWVGCIEDPNPLRLQQKPTVTSGDIDCILHTLAINHWARKKILSQWLEEIGVEIIND